MRFSKTVIASIIALCLTFVMSTSYATSLSFYNIENNSSIDLSSQLSATVSTDGTNAFFSLFNDVDSGTYASITAIYFDYDTSLTTVSFSGDSGDNVSFSDGANPSNLPGGNDPSVSFTAVDSLDADNGSGPMKANGVDATGEFITFMATLSSSYTYDNFLASLADSSFRIGLHITAIDDGFDNSDSYVSTIPVPAAGWLFATALFGFIASSRRKNKTA